MIDIPREVVGTWTIVAPGDSPPAVRYAAEELQRFIEASLGQAPSIEEAAPARGRILVGPEAWRRTAGEDASGLPGLDEGALGEEGARYFAGRDCVAIAGASPRGTLFGVYHFAEEWLGVRFLAAGHTHIPSKNRVSLPEGSWSYVPPFAFRWVYYHELNENPAFAARLRNNTVLHEERYGWGTNQPLISHSLHRFVPVAVYGASNPDYFALVDGHRRLHGPRDGPQVCATHPEVIRLAAEGALRDIEENPYAEAVSVSQNDNDAYCQCSRCMAVNRREGSPMGAHLGLVNAVADEVAAAHPGVKVGTLAYMHTRTPPRRMTPRPNVQIQLCSFEACARHAFDTADCPRNKAFAADLDRWLALTPEVWVWTYLANLQHMDMPHPSLWSTGPNLRLLRDKGVKGVFAQGNGRSPAGELSDLRAYVTSRLLWNPDLDSEALVNEFLDLHYGPAAGSIRGYIVRAHEHAARKEAHPWCFVHAAEAGVDASLARAALALFGQAENAAPGPDIRERVRKASLSAYKAMVETGARFQQHGGRLSLRFTDQAAALIPEYQARARQYGLTQSEEFVPIERDFARIAAYREGGDAVQLAQGPWRLTAVPELDGAVVDLVHEPSGKAVLGAWRHWGPTLQHSVLQDEVSALTGNGLAFPEPEADWREGGVLAMTGQASGAGRVIRRIDARNAAARWSLECIHEAPEAAAWRIIARARFIAGEWRGRGEDFPAFFRREAGGWEQRPLPPYGAGVSPLETHWEDGDALAFFNPATGHGVEVSWRPGQLRRCSLVWNPILEEVWMELRSPAVSLRRGGRFALHYEVRLLTDPPVSAA